MAQDAAGNLSPATSMLSGLLTRAVSPPAFAALNLGVVEVNESAASFELQLAAQLTLQANVSYAVYRCCPQLCIPPSLGRPGMKQEDLST